MNFDLEKCPRRWWEEICSNEIVIPIVPGTNWVSSVVLTYGLYWLNGPTGLRACQGDHGVQLPTDHTLEFVLPTLIGADSLREGIYVASLWSYNVDGTLLRYGGARIPGFGIAHKQGFNFTYEVEQVGWNLADLGLDSKNSFCHVIGNQTQLAKLLNSIQDWNPSFRV